MFLRLELGFDAAGSGDAPTTHGFKNSEQSRHHKNQSPQRIIAGNNNTGNETERADDAARHATPEIKVLAEETVHEKKVTESMSKASSC